MTEQILIFGFKHAGKTTVGRLVAKRLGLPFIDLDREIERTFAEKGERLSVRQIYRKKGGAPFRRLETKTLQDVLRRGNVVVAGAPVHRCPPDLLKRIRHRVFIDVDKQVLLPRLRKTGRPAFFDPNLSFEDAFDAEFAKRQKKYRACSTVRIEHDTPTRMANQIIHRIQRPQICAPVRGNSPPALRQRLRTFSNNVDLVEIWFGNFPTIELEGIFSSARHPVVAVVRRPQEGGQWTGSQSGRISLLQESARAGAAFVDLDISETRGIRKLKEVTKDTFCKIIVSAHVHGKWSEESMKAILKKQISVGADVCKIAAMVKNEQQNISILRVLLWFTRNHPSREVIVSAMGDEGTPARAIAPLLGSRMVFAPVLKREATAPGQLTAREMRRIFTAVGR